MTQGRFTKFITTAAIATAAFVSAANADVDLTKLPPDPAEVCGVLNNCSFSIIEAAIKAEKESGGRLNSIEMIHDQDATTFKAICYTESDQVTIILDAKTGTVLSQANTDTSLPGDGIADLELHESDSGLMWYDIVEGDGATPASPASKVTVHYTGWLVDGTKFDSSVDRGKTIAFALNGVIPGWTEGVGSMKIGGKRKLLIPSNLAYGPRGRGSIPPNAFLIFDVELFEIEE